MAFIENVMEKDNEKEKKPEVADLSYSMALTAKAQQHSSSPKITEDYFAKYQSTPKKEKKEEEKAPPSNYPPVVDDSYSIMIRKNHDKFTTQSTASSSSVSSSPPNHSNLKPADAKESLHHGDDLNTSYVEQFRAGTHVASIDRDYTIEEISFHIQTPPLVTWGDASKELRCSSKRCNKEFSYLTGVLRHHCRRCNRGFCDACCNQYYALKNPYVPVGFFRKAVDLIKYSTVDGSRVCRLCFVSLQVQKEIEFLEPMATLELLTDVAPVCRSWCIAAVVLRERLRQLQYLVPTEQIHETDFELLMRNRLFFAGHSMYLAKIVSGANWSDPHDVTRVKEVVALPRRYNCKTTMCSRYCSERFRLTQCLEILCANVDDADIIKLVVDTLREESLDSIQLIMPLLMHYLKVMLDNRAKELKRAKSVSSPGARRVAESLDGTQPSQPLVYSNQLLDFLLDKATESSAIANEFFWLTKVNFTNSKEEKYRFSFVQSSFINKLGQKRLHDLYRGESLVQALDDIGGSSETDKERLKLKLMERLQQSNPFNPDKPFVIPVNTNIKAKSIIFDKLSVKSSANRPILLPFELAEEYNGRDIALALYKREDLRKDEIVVNLIRMMDMALRAEGLDLNILTYRVLPTSPDAGLIEIVMDSETVHEINRGKKMSLSNWILKHNEQEPIVSVRDRFMRSLAAYCVMTYLLGIGDRHLENIMVTHNGTLFHIDFGFVLGQDPKVMVPEIRLTQDMIEAIGGLDTEDYKKFKDYIQSAFHILRRRVGLFTPLLLLLSDSVVPIDQGNSGFTRAQLLEQIRLRFMVGQSNEEATSNFAAVMERSRNSWGALLIDVTHNEVKGIIGYIKTWVPWSGSS